ncbi:MAG: hypothetical protein KDA89_16605, partial [Planctomycetaceae bacterium]|nr:hypothetical protein [Planctomycetaceae bacterium]
MTQDIDIVIDPVATQQNPEGFLSSLKTSDFLFAESDVRSAVRDAGLFQLLDKEELSTNSVVMSEAGDWRPEKNLRPPACRLRPGHSRLTTLSARPFSPGLFSPRTMLSL